MLEAGHKVGEIPLAKDEALRTAVQWGEKKSAENVDNLGADEFAAALYVEQNGYNTGWPADEIARAQLILERVRGAGKFQYFFDSAKRLIMIDDEGKVIV